MSTHEPIRFESGVYYPLDWIEERLQGGMSVKTFLGNIGLDCTGRGRIYQNGVWGNEILQAIDSTCESLKTRQNEDMGVLGHSAAVVPAANPMKRKSGRPPKGQRIDLITSSDLA